MKRLFVAFLLIMPIAMQAATQTPILDNLTFVKDAYNAIMSVTQTVMKEVLENAYGTIRSIFNNIISILLATIAVFWLFSHIKNGSISREEVYKALMFVIIFIIVYVLMNSGSAYQALNNVLLIPQHLVSALVSNGNENTATQLNNAFIMPFKAYYEARDFGDREIYKALGVILQGLGIADSIAWYGSRLGLFLYQLVLTLFAILVIAIIVVHIYSNFLSCIYLIFLPIMIPLLLISKTKGIFFAWVKSYIGITLYIPLSMIPISIMKSINNLMTNNGGELWHNTTYYTFISVTFIIISFALLAKIPNWLNELLGVQAQGVGAGGALGMLKTAGMGIGAAALGVGKSMAGSLKNLGSKSSGLSKAASIANIATLGAGGAVSGLAKLMKNGFSAMGNHFSGKNLLKNQ